jgi:3-deoxy-D-manno-octulosonic-acid transferase
MDTKKIELLKDFFEREHCFVAGSTWPADEKIMMPGIINALEQFEAFRVIIAPHEITSAHLESIEAQLSVAHQSVIRLSSYKKKPENFRVLLIDSIGLLANLYALGAAAYVGGGFGVGVHSVLEPAAHGAVVSFGPNHRNSPEAHEMTVQKIATPIATESEFQSFLFNLLEMPQHMRERGEKTKAFVLQNVGASRRTANVVARFINR